MSVVYCVGVFGVVGGGSVVLCAGLIVTMRCLLIGTPVLGAAVGLGLGFLLGDIEDAIAGAIGGVLGSVGALQLVSGTLRRGGTRGATAALTTVMAVALAVLAFVPLLGFAEAVLVPALGARMRRSEPTRYAGLRTLARD